MRHKEQDYRWLVVGIYIIVNIIGISALWTSYDYKNDEVGKYLLIAKSIAYDDKIEGNFKSSELYPGLISMSLALNKLTGMNEAQQIVLTIKITHILLVNLIFIFLYLLGKELFGPMPGLLAASYMTLMSYWITENRHFMLDTAAAMFIVASAYFLFRGLYRDERYSMAAAGFLLVVAFAVKFPVAVFGLSFLVAIAINRMPNRKKLLGTAWFLSTIILMLGLFWAFDYAVKGEVGSMEISGVKIPMPASLAETFSQDFNPAAVYTDSIYMIPYHFYAQSIVTFIFPLLAFFVFGIYTLQQANWRKLFQILLIPLPLIGLLSMMTWKESRYIIPALPFFILLACYGMYAFFAEIWPRRDYIKVFAVMAGLLLLFISIGIAKEHVFVKMDYDRSVHEYSDISVGILRLFLLVSIMAAGILVAMHKPDPSRGKIAFFACSAILILGVMPLLTLGELIKRDSSMTCQEFITENMGMLEGKRVSAVSPCAVPKFFYSNSSHFFSPSPKKDMPLRDSKVSLIASSDYLVADEKILNQYEDSLMRKGFHVSCVLRHNSFCIYRVIPNGFKAENVINADNSNIVMEKTRMSGESYFLTHEGSRLMFMPEVKPADYVLIFMYKATGPVPVDMFLTVKTQNETFQKHYIVTDNTNYQSEYLPIGRLAGKVEMSWYFINDTAFYDNQTGRWMDDRNIYVKGIKLAEEP
jgi:4-amino-4-deoxy-L-arabinose transferase-like glycosyltransferase